MTHISTVGRVYKGHHIGPDHGPDHVSTRARPCCSSTEDGQFHDVKRPTTIGHVMGIMCLTQCHLHHPQVITIFTGCIKHSQMVAVYAIGWIPHGNEWDMTNLLFDRQAFQINGYEWGSISPAMGYNSYHSWWGIGISWESRRINWESRRWKDQHRVLSIDGLDVLRCSKPFIDGATKIHPKSTRKRRRPDEAGRSHPRLGQGP